MSHGQLRAVKYAIQKGRNAYVRHPITGRGVRVTRVSDSEHPQDPLLTLETPEGVDLGEFHSSVLDGPITTH